ncbi:MAG: helix-turn-helix domain-containing protein, partial [Clostridiales Family XIII bacterium]|nr:helix-turn-helix domain-containing protein [Clostridiales Family XIII bacterium]
AKRAGGLDLYQAGAAGDVGYVGLGGPLRLYADDSPYAGESFSVTLAVPEAVYARERRAETWRIVLVFATLCAVGIALSIILHRRFMKPITESLAAFEAGEEASFAHFPELAAIMERMSELKSEGAPIPAGLFGGFIGAAKALTPTERVIFEYYADGKTAEEILRYMFIAPPTLKTHNRHIYAKLGVTSLSEMLLYVDLIKKAGLYKEIIGK